MKNNAPNIAFLGISEKVNKSINVNAPFTGIDILNLRNEVISFIYPFNISYLNCIFAFYNISDFKSVELLCRTSKSNKLIFKIDLSLIAEPTSTDVSKVNNLKFENSVICENTFWTVLPIPFPENATILEPDTLNFYANINEIEYPIGKAYFFFAESRPLTEERIAAIKSDSTAAKYIKLRFKCNACDSELIALAGIEKPELKENEIWYQNLPEKFECNCKTNSFSLEYMKKGIVFYLGNPIGSKKAQSSIVRLYEKRTINSILENYKLTINENPEEEEMQKFFKEHPILFHIFSPFRIINKAPILTKYKTDFAILSKKGTLFLIEIEKPSKQIIKGDGGRTSEFNHPFDQVTDWLHTIKEHRIAVLDSLDIGIKEITNIRGVVIIGRDKGNNEEHLRKVKSKDYGEIDFYTYDDLAGSMETLIKEFDDL